MFIYEQSKIKENQALPPRLTPEMSNRQGWARSREPNPGFTRRAGTEPSPVTSRSVCPKDAGHSSRTRAWIQTQPPVWGTSFRAASLTTDQISVPSHILQTVLKKYSSYSAGAMAWPVKLPPASIPYQYRFESWLLHFQSSPLLTQLEDGPNCWSHLLTWETQMKFLTPSFRAAQQLDISAF